MTKKRQRQKRAAKEAQAHHLAFSHKDLTTEDAGMCDTAAIHAKSSGNEHHSADSGNESPPALQNTENWRDHLVTHHKAEAVKAWKYYQACILERYHWFLEKKRKSVAEEFSSMMSSACLSLFGNALSVKTRELQGKLHKRLEEVDKDESLANAIFKDNIEKLESGVPMSELPAIDSHVTSEQIERFIYRYSNSGGDEGSIVQLDDRSDSPDIMQQYGEEATEHTDGGTIMVESFTGSLDSADSGCVPSPRRVRLLSDIWKPDDDELKGSFTSTDFYSEPQTVLSSSQTTTSQTVMQFEPLPVPLNVHSVKDDDSAIQAVVYMKDEPTQAPSSIVTKPLYEMENSFFGLQALAQLSEEYMEGFQSGSPGLMQPPAIQFPPSQVVDPLNPPGTDSVDKHSKAAEAAPDDFVQTQPKPNEDKKKERTTGAVEFTDKKTIAEHEKKLLSEINFSWSLPDSDTLHDDLQKSVNHSTHNPNNTMIPSVVTKPLSFASVLAKPASKEQPMSHRSEVTAKTEENDGKVVFSTKKGNRKFPKSSSLNKTSICWVFENQKKCPWGDECIFAHGKQELKPIPKWFKDSDCSIKTKDDESPHGEPCNDHYCYWRRQFLLRKTTICKLWLGGRCNTTTELCVYAHGKSDLLPLPKYELCRRAMNGKCPLKASECVYAHAKKELRSKPEGGRVSHHSGPSPTSQRRLRTISETAVSSPSADWSVVQKRGGRVRTVSCTSSKSCDSLPAALADLEEFDWQAWSSQQDVPDEEQLDDEWDCEECAICAEEFTPGNPRFLLDCKHDNFHVQCISRWVSEKDPSCPICRCPAMIVADED